MGTEDAKDQRCKDREQGKLISQQWNGRAYIGVDLPWRGSAKIVARQSRFFDQILALAELPAREQWPTILAVSQRYGIPSIWNRARPSLLENNLAALLTGLAFSNHRDWPRLIRTFFKQHNLTIGFRGRPMLDPGAVKDIGRGIQIDKLMAKLQEGFQIKLIAKRSGGFGSGDEQTAKKLSELGYVDEEIKETLKSKTLQDAGCGLYFALNGGRENVSLKGIRNSYSRYKRLSKANQPFPRRPSHLSEDS